MVQLSPKQPIDPDNTAVVLNHIAHLSGVQNGHSFTVPEMMALPAISTAVEAEGRAIGNRDRMGAATDQTVGTQ